MQIIGFNFEKIIAERETPKEVKDKLEINSNINIKEIEQEKVEIVKDKIPLKLSFEFLISYNPQVAKISFQGFTILLFDKEKAKEIQKKWKNKKIEDDIRIPLFNFIMTKCNIKALQLEEELNLPLHIPLPKIQANQNNKSYTG